METHACKICGKQVVMECFDYDECDNNKRPVDPLVIQPGEPQLNEPPCFECGAMNQNEAENMCVCGGDKDSCHGCDLWP